MELFRSDRDRATVDRHPAAAWECHVEIDRLAALDRSARRRLAAVGVNGECALIGTFHFRPRS